MDHYAQVRCLFCETGKENRVVEAIREKDWGRPIFAQRMRWIKRNKEWVDVETPLFPGYVFVYTQSEELSGTNYRQMPHVIRVLTYENGADTLMGRDLEFADWLWRIDGKIDVIQAAQVGDRVEIVDSALKELRGTILRLNKRQRKMLISLDTKSIPMQMWLTYELVENISTKG